MTRLRQMMLEELQRRNYSEITTRKYLRVVSDFAKHFGKSPDKLGPNELRTYQAYLLRERKLTPGTAVNCVAALRFFFIKTLKRHQFREFLPYPRDRRRLPTVLSREEVSRLINAAGNLFRRTLLMTLYGTGMRRPNSRVSERSPKSGILAGGDDSVERSVDLLERLQCLKLLDVCLIRVNDCLVRGVGAHGIVRILLSHCILLQQSLVAVLGNLGEREIRLCGVQVAERLLQLLIDFGSVDNSKQLALLDVRSNRSAK